MPLASLPIQLTRTYDSRDVSRGDFGAGWPLSLTDVNVHEAETVGVGWPQQSNGHPIPTYCVAPPRTHVVSVTLPDARAQTFDPVLSPSCQAIRGPCALRTLPQTTLLEVLAMTTTPRRLRLASAIDLALGPATGSLSSPYPPNWPEPSTADPARPFFHTRHGRRDPNSTVGHFSQAHPGPFSLAPELNWFRTKGSICSGPVEGFNNKAKLTAR